MASILDTTLLENFSAWFVILLVFVVVYSLFQTTKFLGENKALHAIIAICIAFLFIFSKTSVLMVQLLAPWFTVMLIFTVLLLMFYKLFGATSDNLQNLITHHTGVIWTIAVIGIIFIVVAFGYARGQVLLEEGQGTNNFTTAREGMMGMEESADPSSTATGDAVNNAYATIFHPKVLGVIFTLLIAVFAITMLTGAGRPPWPPI